MARREWAGKIVKQEMTGYHWNARIRKSTVLLPDIAAKLLVKEHARAVRIVKAEIRRIRQLTKTYNDVERIVIEVVLDRVLDKLQKGRA